MGLLVILLIGAGIGAYLTFFSLNNPQQVNVNALGGLVINTTVWQIVVVCLAIGMGVAVLLLLPSLLKTAGAARAYKGELARAQAMLEEERRRRLPATPKPTTPEPEATAIMTTAESK